MKDERIKENSFFDNDVLDYNNTEYEGVYCMNKNSVLNFEIVIHFSFTMMKKLIKVFGL